MIPSNWDELRIQARILESEIDSKLAAFGKIGTRPVEYKHTPLFTSSAITSKSDAIQAAASHVDFDSNFSVMCNEIEEHLQRLTQINERMATFVPETEATPTSFDNTRNPLNPTNMMAAGKLSQLHTAKRHREILRDYAQEFRQTKAKLIAARERENLLGSVYRDTNSTTVNLDGDFTSKSQSDVDSSGSNQRSGLQSNISSSTRLLLDEQEKYHRSNRLLDEHLAAASTIRAALRAQRYALRTASSGLSNLSSRFPQVKKLINKIDWRHKQDSIVLGLVIGCCVVFLLIYRFF
ncbi:Golgi SNAP receptor complex member 1 isoform 1 [Schistosoma japonicum]|uniref:Golgi SNAP receptor complex member 1 n=2 Tax=Schistosoma japonicum TaxID=6182 RepID=A0A4Z2CZQ8_SCHJA|nr:Golgi SNAP receptor complex member 1 [Schistosoma japonicum]TNN09755.1 Golgi SNAP receptor complex member 1 isoform 1 [Schistosoma japonicum]